MRRGRPPLRGTSPISPRRVGRPPRTDRAVMNNERSLYGGGFIAGGVIRSNFPRRTSGVRRFNVSRISGRGRPARRESLIQAQFIFDKSPDKTKNSVDDELAVDDQPTTSASQDSPTTMMNGSATKNEIETFASCSTSIVPGIYEDIHLISLVDRASGPSSTVKDLVSLANFQKLPVEYQQYLLKLLPRRDCVVRPNATLEPTFSALKNEYLSAALLDFHDRLYAGEMLWTGEIAPLSSTAAVSPKSCVRSGQGLPAPPISSSPSTSNSQAALVQISQSPPSPLHPPLPKLRINVASGLITVVPQQQKQNGCSAKDYVDVNSKYASDGEEEASNDSSSSADGAKSNATKAQHDLTPYFSVSRTVSNESSDSLNYKSRWSDGSEFQSLRGRPPANQKSRSKRRR